MPNLSSFLLMLLASTCLYGQSRIDSARVDLNFVLFDLPYQSHATKTTGNFIRGFANPSMQQSLSVSNSFYTAAHWGAKKLVKAKSEFSDILWTNVLASGFDLLAFYSPLGMAWLHEEYHRAVLTRHGINSFNEINQFPIGKELIYVNRVSDAGLSRLSDHHKADFRRLMIAGSEGQFLQIQRLQQDNFFLNQDLPHIALYWMSTMTNISYVNQTAGDDFNQRVDEANEADGADISRRDFTGPDFTAWAYALFEPDRAYSDRGTHPSGVGINRYIKPSQLSTEARDYLKKQGSLQWLNLVSPHLFGFPKIKLKTSERGDYFGSFAIRHLLNSFGHAISAELFFQSPRHNILFTVHNYSNFVRRFIGLEGAIIEQGFLAERMYLTARAAMWMQPQDQSFTSTQAQLGGMFSLKGSYPIGPWRPFLCLEGKTRGWQLGNVFLEQNLSLNAGLSFRLP